MTGRHAHVVSPIRRVGGLFGAVVLLGVVCGVAGVAAYSVAGPGFRSSSTETGPGANSEADGPVGSGDGPASGDPSTSATSIPSPAPTASASARPTVDPATATGFAGGLQDPVVGTASSLRAAGVAPVAVSIADIGVSTGLESLARDEASGWVQPPVAWQSAGWYSAGVVPGDIGPAVVAGHIDSNDGPAVFARLAELQPGDRIDVALSDGTSRAFAVDRVEQVAKESFPSAEVYGPTPDAQLRLITCDGVFDEDYGHYLDNRIVFATLLPTN